MVVFCTTCKDRVQHIERTLPQNLRDNENCKFVLVDYNSPDHLLDYLKTTHKDAIDSGKLVVYSFPAATTFKMAHAKNMAHRLGILEGADILVNLDADNFTGPGFADYVRSKLKEPHSFLWAKMITEGPDRLPRGVSGRIAVSINAFTKLGGYDEKYETWSPDDKDFNFRLRKFGYIGQEIDNKYLKAVLHSNKMRFKEYKHAEVKPADSSAPNQFSDVAATAGTVVNHGRIGLGVVYKNFDFDKPINIDPIPTRIFGIGMHKTATTSLHTALTILGYDSAHWKTAHWAKAIWNEMIIQEKSPTVEGHYAVCDLPITLLYKELDAVYPGSKFILTVRDEDKWLQSVKNHWDPALNPYRKAWNKDPFTHKIHKIVYGRKDFDPEVMLERYRRHNAEVKEYFRGRWSDLLVMNSDLGEGWRELCGFLKKPIPGVAYPKMFVTQK